MIGSGLLVVILPVQRAGLLRRLAQLGQRGYLVRLAADAGLRTDACGVAHRQRRRHASAEAIGVTLIPLHVIGGTIAILSGFVALYALKGATAAPEERDDLRLRHARHVAQRRRHRGRARRRGDEHPCGSGDGLSRHHVAPHRSPTVGAIAPGGARRDAGGVRARCWRASYRRSSVPAGETAVSCFLS